MFSASSAVSAVSLPIFKVLTGEDLVAPGSQKREWNVRGNHSYSLSRIVLASNRQTGLPLRDLRDLLRPEVKRVALANPLHDPYSLAAKQAMESLGIWNSVRPKLVYTLRGIR